MRGLFSSFCGGDWSAREIAAIPHPVGQQTEFERRVLLNVFPQILGNNVEFQLTRVRLHNNIKKAGCLEGN